MSITGKKKPLILIVDDVELNRFLLGNIIEDMGYEFAMAENGVEALRIFTEQKPQLVLMDVSMPEMDGFDFCKVVKSDPLLREVPLIFISAHDAPGSIIRGFELGCEDYITKPFVPEIVKARVDLHLHYYESIHKLQEQNRKLHASLNEQLNQIELEKKAVLYGLANVVRKNSGYAEKHMERVAYNCRMMAQALQLSNDFDREISNSYIDTIELTAPLCDVGNVVVPMEILQKEGKLTQEEMAIMQTHTTFGAELLQDIANSGDQNAFMQMSVEIAQNHHENWDGSGYPAGKSGNDIPLSAQIVALISAYCALTEDRKYRPAYTPEEAVEILALGSGIKFNEKIYSVCRKIARQFH